MEISDVGIQLIQDFEGFAWKAYFDVTGHAIVYGNHFHPDSRSVIASDTVNFKAGSPESVDYIKYHFTNKKFYDIVSKRIEVTLSQSQLDALSSFFYNVGGITKSLTKAINSQDPVLIQKTWLSYNKSKGEYSQVLANRRQTEYTLFSTGVYNKSQPTYNKTSTTYTGDLLVQVVSYASAETNVQPITSFTSNTSVRVNEYLASVSMAPDIPWSEAFVYWCYDQACRNLNIVNPIPKSADIHVLTNLEAVTGLIIIRNTTPEMVLPGHIALITEAGLFRVGIVQSIKNGIISLIEGVVSQNMVLVRSVNLNEIAIFIAPRTVTLGYNSTQQEATNPKQANYVLLKNFSSNSDTVQQFINNWQIINMTPDDLLNYEQNEAAIYNGYNADQRVQYDLEASVDLITQDVILAVPSANFKNPNLFLINETISKNESAKTFMSEHILQMFNNPLYKKIDFKTSGQGYSLDGNLFKKFQKVKIWAWSRATDPDGSNLIDLTPFIKTISTNVSDNGGNFSITLPRIDFKEGIDITTASLDDLYIFKQKTTTEYSIDTIFHKSIHGNIQKTQGGTQAFQDDNNELADNGWQYYQRNQSFFYRIFQPNDLLIIRLEELEIDKSAAKTLNNDIKVPSNGIAGQYLDMIALIDSISNISGEGQNDVVIQGRDLSKLLIDDGVYFFPIEYGVNREEIIKNSSATKTGNRLIVNPTSNDQSQLNNNTSYNTGELVQDTNFNFFQTQTIEQWLVFIFSQLTNISITPNQLFKGYKDKNYVVIRKQLNGQFYYDRTEASGIWQAVQLIIDPEVGLRRLADPSFTTATGSLINLIRKICQPPFVEFFMDTYGDKYAFICRKPPFGQEAFKTNFCINIFEEDVIQDSLQNCKTFYTWYKLNPQGSLLENLNSESLLLVPAVMLPEYMDIWGSRVLDVTTQYLDFDFTNSDQTKAVTENILQQARQDLDWLIETNVYLPFTSEGSITIKSDRRIKRGINIRYYPTGEIFYVDSVSHTKNFGSKTTESTTIQVSRGMMEKHIDKYFQIVHLLRNEPKTGTLSTNQYGTPGSVLPNNQNLGFGVQSQPTENIGLNATKPAVLSSTNNDNNSKDTWTVDKSVFDFFTSRQHLIR